MQHLTYEDIEALMIEMQSTFDDSRYIADVYIQDDIPNTICAHFHHEMLNEPGATGAFPFYKEKTWLVNAVESFAISTALDILSAWNVQTPMTSAVETIPVSITSDGECSILVQLSF